MKVRAKVHSCAACPLSKHVRPAHVDARVLGGSPLEVYVGQLAAGMFLPCHVSEGYDASVEQARSGAVPVCGGARAIMQCAPANEKQFASIQALIRFHTGLSAAEVEKQWPVSRLHELASIELEEACRGASKC